VVFLQQGTTVAPEHPQTGEYDFVAARKTERLPWVLAAVCSFVLAGIFAVSAALAAAFSGREETLPQYGESTTAVVTGSSQESYDDDAPCGPTYRFTVDGTSYDASSPNVSEAYCSFEVGDPIEITYDAADPETSSAPAAHYTSAPGRAVRAPLAAAGAFTAAGIVFVVLAIQLPRRRARRA
jgi:hypothetical protein